MNLNIIYVDDEEYPRTSLQEAIECHNRQQEPVHINLKLARHPDVIKDLLDESDDLVLADVYYEEPDVHDVVNRLDRVISTVKEWAARKLLSRPLPIIAYTGRGKDALASCLKHRDDLFDIWDKSTASASYVTWRLSQLALELARVRPDSVIQRLIRQMEPSAGAAWHNHVVDMTRGYGAGLSEFDQITRCGGPIANIASDLKVWEKPCKDMWGLMLDWEFLSRAASPKARGHARHVVNVFWLGYFLIYHKELREWFRSAWTSSVRKHSFMRKAQSVDALNGLSNAWYFAGLFHDVAGCGQKYISVCEKADTMVSRFVGLNAPVRSANSWPEADLASKAETLWTTLGAISKPMKPIWEKSVIEKHPDHGILAGLHFQNSVKDPIQRCFAAEAARAMAVHNMISDMEFAQNNPLTWEKEPMICLLLLCDQIQTWDRERNDEALAGPDSPQRAQLTNLEVTSEKGWPKIMIVVDYIAPRYLDHAPIIVERIKAELEKTIKEYPLRALRRIAEPWPFDLEVQCKLNGRLLSQDIKFLRNS